MYDDTLNRGEKKHFCHYCLQNFSTEEIVKHILKIALKLMVSQGLRCLKKMNILNSKNLKKKSHQ